MKPKFTDNHSGYLWSGGLEGLCGTSRCLWGQIWGQDFHISSIWTIFFFFFSSKRDQVGRRSSKDSFDHSTYSAAKKLGLIFHEPLFWLVDHFSKGAEKSLSSFHRGFDLTDGRKNNCAETTKIRIIVLKLLKLGSVLSNNTSWMLSAGHGRGLLGYNPKEALDVIRLQWQLLSSWKQKNPKLCTTLWDFKGTGMLPGDWPPAGDVAQW